MEALLEHAAGPFLQLPHGGITEDSSPPSDTNLRPSQDKSRGWQADGSVVNPVIQIKICLAAAHRSVFEDITNVQPPTASYRGCHRLSERTSGCSGGPAALLSEPVSMGTTGCDLLSAPLQHLRSPAGGAAALNTGTRGRRCDWMMLQH